MENFIYLEYKINKNDKKKLKMNKYLVIISILVLLVSGCDKISTVGEAGFVMSADITRSIDCGSNYVNLYIS